MPANSDSTCSASLTSQTTSAPGSRSAVTTSAPRAAQLVGEGRPDASAATRDDDPLAGDGHASAASASWMCPFDASTLASPGPRLSGPPWNASIRPPASVINKEPAPTSHA